MGTLGGRVAGDDLEKLADMVWTEDGDYRTRVTWSARTSLDVR